MTNSAPSPLSQAPLARSAELLERSRRQPFSLRPAHSGREAVQRRERLEREKTSEPSIRAKQRRRPSASRAVPSHVVRTRRRVTTRSAARRVMPRGSDRCGADGARTRDLPTSRFRPCFVDAVAGGRRMRATKQVAPARLESRPPWHARPEPRAPATYELDGCLPARQGPSLGATQPRRATWPRRTQTRQPYDSPLPIRGRALRAHRHDRDATAAC